MGGKRASLPNEKKLEDAHEMPENDGEREEESLTNDVGERHDVVLGQR